MVLVSNEWLLSLEFELFLPSGPEQHIP